MPGALKKALDWLVGRGELTGKPVTLFYASARGLPVQASLAEKLTVMSAGLVRDGAVNRN